MKYQINLTEHSQGFIKIEADDEEEALNMAIEEYHNGNFNFPGIDLEFSNPIKLDYTFFPCCPCH